MSASDIIASIALVLSVLSLVLTERRARKSDKEQSFMKDEQERMRKLLLEKETKSAINEMKADLGANLVKIGKNNYRLKVFNRGKVEAKQINIKFPDDDGNEYLVMSQVTEKFPYEILYPQQSIEIIASSSYGCKSKYKIVLVWDDEFKRGNEQEVIVSI